ncbi:cysteine desulfurase family protein [Roseimicrobium sp. ORNL1]|uniref:cysteine desulfurase family protein n=1 Tax=Roseimicrobium sp. ORNL1 TaxID=2711231 RepID=UPI0013E148A1|nr:cysteine desulfurase family protein [Roseimicrobium sp. ORNL1]QIF05371.1 cysteine desulfurase [Roseimicrobium sp. ORNL1]
MPGYFDHNATTPLHPVARDAWLKASERHWQNPSGLYREAAETKHRLEEARERLGELLGCEPQRIVFTSGATEANNAVLRMLAAKLPGDSTVFTSCMEHPSVQVPLRATFGKRVREVPSLPDTSLDWEAFATALQPQSQRPALVTIMAANNECGTLLPWQQIALACREAGVRFHCDATQWIGKMPAMQLGECDYITGSAHKFGGPKGIGFLVLRSEDESLGLLIGGPQEEGRRAGTENYPSIGAMVTVLETLTPTLESVSVKQKEFREKFETEICQAIPGTKIVGQNAERLWNTSMLILPRHDHRKWLARLSQQGFAVSTGSACSAGHDGASQVLQAIGATPEEMKRVLRISSGWETCEEEWHGLLAAILRVRDSLDG